MERAQKIIAGRYRIERKLGSGGSGTVFLVYDLQLEKEWAVKVLKKKQAETLDEINMLKKLSHPRLPRIVDVIEEQNHVFLVMDDLRGKNLEQIKQEQGAFSEKEVIRIGIQTAGILQFLHTRQRPILYGDMKPHNLILRSDGEVMLSDFGTAFDGTQLSVQGQRGTPGYAAPEQYGESGRLDERSDIYSLGMTLLSLLCTEGIEEEQFSIGNFSGKIKSADLYEILKKSTARRPSRRYQTAEALKEALISCQKEERAGIAATKKQGLLAVLLTTIGIFFLFAARELTGISVSELNRQYTGFLMQAVSADDIDAEAYFQKAMDLLPTRDEAYLQYLTYMKKQGMLENALAIVASRVGTKAGDQLNMKLGELYFSGDVENGLAADYCSASVYFSRVSAAYAPEAEALSRTAQILSYSEEERDYAEIHETLQNAFQILRNSGEEEDRIEKMQLIAGVYRIEAAHFRDIEIDAAAFSSEILREAMRRTAELVENKQKEQESAMTELTGTALKEQEENDKRNMEETAQIQQKLRLNLASLLLADPSSTVYSPEEAASLYREAEELSKNEEEKKQLRYREAFAYGEGHDEENAAAVYEALVQDYPEAQACFTFCGWLLDHEKIDDAILYFQKGRRCPDAEESPLYEILCKRLKGAGKGWNS